MLKLILSVLCINLTTFVYTQRNMDVVRIDSICSHVDSIESTFRSVVIKRHGTNHVVFDVYFIDTIANTYRKVLSQKSKGKTIKSYYFENDHLIRSGMISKDEDKPIFQYYFKGSQLVYKMDPFGIVKNFRNLLSEAQEYLGDIEIIH